MSLKDIIIILFFLYLFYKLYSVRDNFSVNAYNSNEITDTSKSQLEIQTDKIKESLDKIFKQNTDFIPEKIDKTSFKEFSFYENFIYEKDFKNIFLNNLKEILSQNFPNISLNSTSELKNIYFKDISNDRHYIFDITVTSQNYGFTRIFSCYAILKNIKNYLLDDNTLISGLNIDNSNLEFKYIIEIKNTDNLKLLSGKTPFDYYQIKNKLHLMDPFVTTGKEIQITTELINNFDKTLSEKTELLKKYSSGNCYNFENNVIFTGENSDENKIKCENEDPLNKWDTIPFNEFDCPFYEKNKNYPNSFGKLIDDNTCEMPLNIKKQGYRFYSLDPKFSPLCYNCKTDTVNDGTLGTCCDKQLDKTEYPELLSPDYAYPNDKMLRNKYKNIFDEKNLKIE